MGLLSFVKSLFLHDDDSDFIESVTQQPMKNINNQVDLGNAITDDIEMSASDEVHEVTEGKKDVTKEKVTMFALAKRPECSLEASRLQPQGKPLWCFSMV